MIAGPPQKYKWSLSESSRLLSVARILFTLESGLYLQNSQALGLFRQAPASELLDECRETLVNFLGSADYLKQLLHFCHEIESKSSEEWSDTLSDLALSKLMIDITDKEKAKVWGALIKECFRQGTILDMGDKQVKKYWKVFCKKLKKEVKSKKFESENITRCVFAFIEKLKAIGSFKSALALESYIELATIIMRCWELENKDPNVCIPSVLGMLLGPSLFAALHLEDQLFSIRKHEEPIDKLSNEFKFGRNLMSAILSESAPQDSDLDLGLIGKFNQLILVAPSKDFVDPFQAYINPLFIESPRKVTATTKSIALPEAKSNEDDTLVVQNPLFGKALPDKMSWPIQLKSNPK